MCLYIQITSLFIYLFIYSHYEKKKEETSVYSSWMIEVNNEYVNLFDQIERKDQ